MLKSQLQNMAAQLYVLFCFEFPQLGNVPQKHLFGCIGLKEMVCYFADSVPLDCSE
jgi:hypothetical protein